MSDGKVKGKVSVKYIDNKDKLHISITRTQQKMRVVERRERWGG
jgi:hypothetical protein